MKSIYLKCKKGKEFFFTISWWPWAVVVVVPWLTSVVGLWMIHVVCHVGAPSWSTTWYELRETPEA